MASLIRRLVPESISMASRGNSRKSSLAGPRSYQQHSPHNWIIWICRAKSAKQ